MIRFGTNFGVKSSFLMGCSGNGEVRGFKQGFQFSLSRFLLNKQFG